MLEIRTSTESYIVFDTEDGAPVMRFDSRAEAINLIVALVEAETLEGIKSFDIGERRD